LTSHSETTELVSLELDLLEDDQRAAMLRHLETCSTCRMRREQVRAGLTSIAEETRQRFDERSHVPPDLLEEYSVAPSGLGAEVVSAIEAHLASCPSCHDETQRARTATEATWPMPIVAPPPPASSRPASPPPFVAPSASATQGGAGPAAAAGARHEPGPFRTSLRHPAMWIGFAGFALAAVLLLLRFLGPPEPPPLAAGVPLRLFGATGTGSPSATVQVPARASIALFVKLPASPDPSARYRVALRSESGVELSQVVQGTSFDRSASVALLVDPGRFRSGERVDVQVTKAGDSGRPPLFLDSFRIQKMDF
jgi:hypothetical protein